MAELPCRVYWGSHGCKLERGHDGPHLCECADDPGVDPVTREYIEDRQVVNVGAPPYYGPDTKFWGEDATKMRPRTPDNEGQGRSTGVEVNPQVSPQSALQRTTKVKEGH